MFDTGFTLPLCNFSRSLLYRLMFAVKGEIDLGLMLAERRALQLSIKQRDVALVKVWLLSNVSVSSRSISSVRVKSKSAVDDEPAVASLVLNSISDPQEIGVRSPLTADCF